MGLVEKKLLLRTVHFPTKEDPQEKTDISGSHLTSAGLETESGSKEQRPRTGEQRKLSAWAGRLLVAE